MKQCRRCEQFLDNHWFHSDIKRKDGLQSYCKPCKREMDRKTRLNNFQQNNTHWIAHIFRLWAERYKIPIPTLEDRHQLGSQMLKRLRENPICPFTDENLIYGQNAQIDHKIPASKRKDLIFDSSNLQWVSATYNKHKSNATDEEFLAFCHLVVKTAKQ